MTSQLDPDGCAGATAPRVHLDEPRVELVQWKSTRFGGVGAPKLSRRQRPIAALCIHTTEGHERAGSARNVASWFDNPAAKGNAHYIVDPSQCVQFAADDRAAWHATVANGWSLGIELCGKAGQTPEQWADAESLAVLERAAQLIAVLCQRYDIEPRRLTHDELRELRAGRGEATGLFGHVDVTRALNSGSHWDPGPAFPWEGLLERAGRLVRSSRDAPTGARRPLPIA